MNFERMKRIKQKQIVPSVPSQNCEGKDCIIGESRRVAPGIRPWDQRTAAGRVNSASGESFHSRRGKLAVEMKLGCLEGTGFLLWWIQPKRLAPPPNPRTVVYL